MFGYVIYFAGGPIAFTSKRIKVVAKSSAEAEYAAAAYTCMELTFVRNILGDLGYPVQAPVVICVDNKAAVDICKSLGVTKRSKHFTDAIHYFRRCYLFDLLTIGRVVPRYGECLICKWKEVRNQT